MTDVGLYIHVPFCQTKCGYCDFYSVPLLDRPTSPLVQRIVTELVNRTGDAGCSIRTVFVGGGTPTVLPPSDLRVLCEALRRVLDGHPVAEFTVEANPATVDGEKLAMLIDAGVDRLSMGAQSWNLRELETLERLHTPNDIGPGVASARRLGIRRINLDLIFGIPGQTLDSWDESLRRTIDLGVDHIACYGLTYEPGTRLTAQRDAGSLTPCDEQLEADMYLAAIDLLTELGHEQYEISNFARSGQRCLHNLIYWRNEPYLGVGPSAAGYLNGRRYKNVADLGRYMRFVDEQGTGELESECVTGCSLAGETAMMELRLTDGIDVRRFARSTGLDPGAVFAESIGRHVAGGLLEITPDWIRLTRLGLLFADTVIADLYAEACLSQHGSSAMTTTVAQTAPGNLV